MPSMVSILPFVAFAGVGAISAQSEFKVVTQNIWNEGLEVNDGVFFIALAILKAQISSGIVGLTEVRWCPKEIEWKALRTEPFENYLKEHLGLDEGEFPRPAHRRDALRKPETNWKNETLQQIRLNFPAELAEILNAMEYYIASEHAGNYGNAIEKLIEVCGRRTEFDHKRKLCDCGAIYERYSVESKKQFWSAPKKVDYTLQDVGLMIRNANPEKPDIKFQDAESIGVFEPIVKLHDPDNTLLHDRGSAAGANLSVFGIPFLAVVAHLDYMDYYTEYLGGSTQFDVTGKSLKVIAENAVNAMRNEESDPIKNAARTQRLREAKVILDKMNKQPGGALLMGDFNAPSDLDWQQANKDQDTIVSSESQWFFSNPKASVNIKWPVTAALKEGGLIDAFRHLKSSPKVELGFTNPVAVEEAMLRSPDIDNSLKKPNQIDLSTGWYANVSEVDRLDYLFIKGTSDGVGRPILCPSGCALMVNKSEVIGKHKFATGASTTSPFAIGGHGHQYYFSVRDVKEMHDSTPTTYWWPSDHNQLSTTLVLDCSVRTASTLQKIWE
eukprot:TRINITY_DN61737_c0_g1_i1.p1 TRINITY_DN61737_c0_g1~~TRINITY_DN61737_c0_g1_i1.p1  ORF type:complete len:570 (+),score=89.25 TRINITY_DN61737_c0_g1_i1:46-1710(+)